MYAVSRSTLKRICRSHGIPRWPYSRTPNETEPLPKPDQTDAAVHASDRALTTLVLGTSNATNTTHDPATLTQHTSQLVLHPTQQKYPPDGRAKPETTAKDKHIKNAAANTYTIKVTYRKDTVKFSFRLSDGLARLEKLVATRFQLSDGSFSLKYEDEDGDIILIACDNDLTASLGAFRQPDAQTVIRLSVWPVAGQNPDA
ncbi:putative transcription factor Nin-like family [Helianthus anomalus]